MDAGYYRFALGSFDCVSLSDGSWSYPLQSFFANVPLASIREALSKYGSTIDYITTPYSHLYVNTGEHRVLVDTGAGDYFAPKAGKLPQSMAAAGIDPAEIDTVIITHAHPDHIGGILDREGNPVYSGARIYLSRDEWRYWCEEASRGKAPERFVSTARGCLLPIQDRVTLLEGESQVGPGIRAIPAPGHTPGHMAVSIGSGQERLLYIGDTAVHPLHLEHPDWYPIYDLLPQKAAASKQRIFDRAVAEKALVMGQHFAPFPSLGTVAKRGAAWRWRPIALGPASTA